VLGCITSRRRSLALLLACVVPSALADGRSGDAPPSTAREQAVIKQYATILHAAYADALTQAERLRVAVDLFLESPDPGRLAKARDAWIAARIPYLQTEASRFCEGPIEAVEPRINAWPIDESYIDSVAGAPESGYINQPSRHPAINRALLIELNEREGEQNICAGYHAVEFLLWGQDLRDDGPGNRPHTDYVAGGSSPNAERRRRALAETVSLLVEDLRHVRDEWAPGRADNHRARFLALPPKEALAAIIKGMGTLSGPELAGERLTVPYETKEQEDEHSCFSDTTHQDVIYDLVGVRNLHLGRYQPLQGGELRGPGLHDLVAAADPDLAERLRRQIETSLAAARALPQPFDRTIRGADHSAGRKAVRELIQSVQAQADLLAESAARLSIPVQFVLP
jgi:putative iron-regulated protein